MIYNIYYAVYFEQEIDHISEKLPTLIEEHIKKNHVHGDINKSIVAYTKLGEILKKYTKQTIDDIYFEENGKPSIKGGFISISHIGEVVAVCYSETQIGIDIEKIGKASKMIYNKVFHQDEIENVTNDDFYIRWTSIEAKRKLENTKAFKLEDFNKYFYNTMFIEENDNRYVLTIASKEKNVILVRE